MKPCEFFEAHPNAKAFTFDSRHILAMSFKREGNDKQMPMAVLFPADAEMYSCQMLLGDDVCIPSEMEDMKYTASHSLWLLWRDMKSLSEFLSD